MQGERRGLVRRGLSSRAGAVYKECRREPAPPTRIAMRLALLALLLLTAVPVHAAAPGLRELHAAAAAKRTLGAPARKLEGRLRARGYRRGDRSPVRVRVRLEPGALGTAAALAGAGLRVEREHPSGLVEGVVPAEDLERLAALPAVRFVRAPLRGRLRVGSVTTEGDAAARADLARAQGFDGSGVAVGVISDGIDSLAAAQGSGDLGAVTVPPGCQAGSGDEGTAILEIVHDMAPGAGLLFGEGISSSLAFIDAVSCLRAGGADVVIDDIGFFDEPFFEDGPVADAVRAAAQGGVSFHSAAGNDADRHLEQDYRAAPGDTLHDFRGGPTDTSDNMVVAGGDTLACVLQWNDPFDGSGNDYDLYLLSASDQLLAAGETFQTGTQDPIEIIEWTNFAGTPRTVQVVINLYLGATRRLEMFCFGGDLQEYLTAAGSIIGHPAVPEAVAVGAIDVLDPGLDDLEPFSSQGPALVSFPSTSSRPKPDLAAFDGVDVSNAGGFPACPPFCAFFGTSAAAPHSAAVAALLLEKNPFLSPGAILGILRGSAVDVGPAGFDPAAGAGRLDALAALGAVLPPECYAAGECADDGDPCTAPSCPAGECVTTPLDCGDGNVCNGAESCTPAVGCVAGEPLVCVDADPCTTNACDAARGCFFAELPALDYIGCALASRLRPLVAAPGTQTSPRAARAVARMLRKLDRAAALVAGSAARGGVSARQRLKRARKLANAIARLAERRRSALAPVASGPIAAEARSIAIRIETARQFL